MKKDLLLVCPLSIPLVVPFWDEKWCVDEFRVAQSGQKEGTKADQRQRGHTMSVVSELIIITERRQTDENPPSPIEFANGCGLY